MTQNSILIVDDETLTLNNLRKALEREGYEIYMADCGEKALEIVETFKPHLILLDLMLPGISGLEVLRRVKESDPETVVIMMSAYEILEKAVQAMKLGAYDYLLKPFKINDLKNIVRRALETFSLRIRVKEHLNSEKGKYYFGRIVGESRKIREVLELAQRAAQSDKTTILLQGESGTGKEVMAKAIHYHSPRAGSDIVDINCAAIPDNLMESELFGYEAGAFTDARKRKIGLLEKGNEGTVFFDEIGDMSLNMQAKLLRVLESGTFNRLGGSKEIQVNIRVIAATNKDLAKAVEKGDFREDLFYRLNVVLIRIPPLRERREDILPLTLYFIQEYNRELKKTCGGISPEAAKTLSEYPWPGNIRELRNAIERILSLYNVEEIRPQDLPVEIRNFHRFSGRIPAEAENNEEAYVSLDELEKRYIHRVLQHTGGNRTQAAKILGIHATSLFRKLKTWDAS